MAQFTGRSHVGLHIRSSSRAICFQHQPHRHSNLGGISRQRQVLRRTSEHWWEDSEELDGVAGEVLHPKTLLLVASPAQDGPEGVDAWVQGAVAAVRTTLGPGQGLAAGFTGGDASQAAESLWSALGAGGPPYFRKVRSRPALGLEKPDPAAADQLLGELLGQNWRLELDAGLGGSLRPTEHILLVGTRPSIQSILDTVAAASTHGGGRSQGAAAGPVDSGYSLQGVSVVQVPGWNTEVRPEQGEQLKPLNSWKELGVRLVTGQQQHVPA